MENILFDKIKEYDSIIILRHTKPDLDALGSQLGLYHTLKYNYPNKEIYVVGDFSLKYGFIGKMDLIEDDVFSKSLAIIVDVSVSNMVSDNRYLLCKEVFVIDHHKNGCDITTNHLCDTTKVAASQYICEMLLHHNLIIPPLAATCFYGGIITDSGRFLYGDHLDETFLIASKLIELKADYKYIYDNIYVETLKDREKKNYFSNKFIVDNGVAYLKNTQEVFEKFGGEFNDISRGMLSVMAGIQEIKVWLNFTYDIERNIIVGEFRSRNIPIIDIAKKYGGGGHALACGASLKDWDEVDLVINDFVELVRMEEKK